MAISKPPAPRPVANKNVQPTANQANKSNPANSKPGNQSNSKPADKQAQGSKGSEDPDKSVLEILKPPPKPLKPEVFLDDDSEDENDIKCDKCMQSFWFKKELVSHLVEVHKISEEEQEKERQRKAAALREEIRRKALSKQMAERQRLAQRRMEEQRRSAMSNQQQLHSALARANQAARLRNEQRLGLERSMLAKRREVQSMQDRNARAKRLELQMLIERRNRLMSQTANRGLAFRPRDLGSNREIRLGSGIVIQRSDAPSRVEANENTIFKFHYDNDNRFVCQLCERKFGDPNGMINHWKSHVKTNSGRPRSEIRGSVGRPSNNLPQKRKRETVTLDESDDDDVKADSDYDDRRARSRSDNKKKKGKSSKSYDWGDKRERKESRQKNDRERRAEQREERQSERMSKKKSQNKTPQWSPYLMWSVRFKNKLMAEFPEWSSSEINKATSEGWKNVSKKEVERLEDEVTCVNERIQCREDNTEYWTAYKLWAKRRKTEILEENPEKKDSLVERECQREWDEVRKEYKDILEDQVTVINRHNLSSKKGKPICNAFLLWSIETMESLQKKDSNITEVAIGKAITEGWQEVEEEKLDALVAESVRINQLLARKHNDDNDTNKSKKKNEEEEEEEEIGDDEDWDPFVVQLKNVQDIINDVEGKGETQRKRKISLKEALKSAKREANSDAWNQMEPEVVVNSEDENEDDEKDKRKAKNKKAKKTESETVDIDDDEVSAEKLNINIALTEGKSFANDLKQAGIDSEDNNKEGAENTKNYSQEEFDKILNKSNKKNFQKQNDSDENEAVEDMDGAERDIEQRLNEDEITKQLEKETGIHIQELSGKNKEDSPALSKATIESAQRLGLSYKDLFLY